MKEMIVLKRGTKVLIGLAAVVAAPIIINKLITKKAQERIKPRESESIYNWEYGDIRFVTAGDNEKPPMLLVHGVYPAAGALEFNKVIEKFAQNYHVYAIDLLGFGYSDKPNLTYSAYLYVSLVKDFIDDIIGTPVVAMASLHSAAVLANCAKLNPELFTKLILISPTGTTEIVEVATDIEGGLKKVLESPVFGTSFYHALVSKRALPEFFELEGLGSKPEGDDLEELYLSAHAEGVGGKYPIAALLSKFFNTDIKATLDDLTVPFHIITGDVAPDSTGFALWKGMGANTPTSLIEDARLLPHIDRPEEFYILAQEKLQSGNL